MFDRSFKMKCLILIPILMLTVQVNSQESSPEITASGDGAEKIPISTEFLMIDENGDLVGGTVVPGTSIIMETEDAPDGNSSDTHTTILSATDEAATDAIITTTVSVPETTTNIPTTTTLSTTTIITTTTEIPTTMMETSTTETTTTTMAPTTTTTTAATTTTEAITQKPTTSTTSSPATTKMLPKTTTSSTAQIPALGTTFIPDPEAKQCVFLDTNLMCNQELVCYGEGEIDCSEDADAAPSETTSMNKIASTSTTEDYSDFDGFEGSIGTFPPDLIGVVSPKNKFPHLFKMGALDTTDGESGATTESTEETTTLFPTSTMITTPGDQETTIVTEFILDAEMKTSEHKTLITVTESEKSTVATLSTSAPTKMTKEDHASVAVTAETIASNVSVESAVTTAEYVLSQVNSTTMLPPVDATATEGSEQPVLVRRKREDTIIESGSESASPSMSESLHVAALEASQRKKAKACRTTGNLLCTPQPTITMCKGKTFCQVISGTAETSEKSTSAKGVENWAIAVIAICAIAAALTISLLFYLVITSWKKLKVQPQNGVTTLTYVNNTPP